MQINTKKNSFLMILIVVSFLFSNNSLAVTSISDLANQQKETDKKIKELEDKAALYRSVIEIKEKEKGTLSSQIELIEAEIAKIESEIEIKKREIENLNDRIKNLEKQIQEHEESIKSQKIVLGGMLQVYYENKKQNVFSNLLGNKEDYFMEREDRLLQTEDKLKEIISNINSLKKNLEKEKKEIEDSRNKITENLIDLNNKNSELESKKEQKEFLMQETEGEQNKYEKLLARVEEQKNDLLNIDQLASASGLSADKYAKPKSGLASTSWFYSQKDPRWANDNIGRSSSSMKDWGCAVSAVAMVFKYYGANITPEDLASKSKYFSWDLIMWPGEWSNPNLKLSSYGHSHGNINWTVVDSELKKNRPVIVYIKKKNVGGGHYVVIHHKVGGKYVVHDPYFGANIFLDTSMALVGQMGTNSATLIDQMIIYQKR